MMKKQQKIYGKELIKMTIEIVNKKNSISEDEVYIKPPIPLSIEWHRLTDWAEAAQLYTTAKFTWDEWKNKGLIPFTVVQRVEEHE